MQRKKILFGQCMIKGNLRDTCWRKTELENSVIKSWKFLRNFRRNILKKFSWIFSGKVHEKFSWISRDYVSYSVPQKIRKIGEISEISWKKIWKKSLEFLKTNSQNSDPLNIFQIGDQFRRISQEFLMNQSLELVLEKFPGISSKQDTKTVELEEIPHFCYLGCR